MLTALSISSMLISTATALRRVSAPNPPIQNRPAASRRYQDSGTDINLLPARRWLAASFPITGDDDRPDHRNDQQHRCHLKGDGVGGHKVYPQPLDRVGGGLPGRYRPGHARDHR